MSSASRSPSRLATHRSAPFDVERLRKDFPILEQRINGHPLVYLDNAATTQKPRVVIEAISRYYEQDNANIHRGVHQLSERATHDFEAARSRVQRFVNAAEAREIIFVRGTTEAINLVAQSFGRSQLATGDEILITGMEHHSNIVPWQMLCAERGARLRVVPIDDRGELAWDALEAELGPRTRLLALAHVSNALGTLNPIGKITALAHERGIPVLVDGAQAVSHLPVDVQAIGCDFYAFSGHKLFGPTGIGVLYGRAALLEEMPPWQGGGDMIASVSFEKTTYNVLPFKFEAGTPAIAGAIGLARAIDYVEQVGLEQISLHEHDLLAYATEAISEIAGVQLIGTAREKAAVLSFVMKEIHPHDIGTVLNEEGIAIRTGHHCAQPVMERFGIPATARASFAFYNTREEVDALVRGLRQVMKIFG